MSSALDGVKVVDLTRNVAGPYAAKLLAEYGASVVKIEPPGGDPARRFGPFPGDEPHPEHSGLFLHLNRNKQSIVLDPARDADSILALAAKADILLEDYAPGEPSSWGWGFGELAAANPGLVVASVTPFGQSGPYRDYRGSEITLQAIGGPLVTNGHAEREPLKLGGHFAHYHAGLATALACTMALRRSEATGIGDWIDMSIFECQAACRDRRTIQITSASYTGVCGGRLTSTSRGLGIGARECSDGFINIFGAGARLPRLLAMIGEHEAARTIDPHDIDQETKDRLEAVYQRWLSQQKKGEATRIAQENRLLAGAFNSIADVAEDEHYKSRGVWDTVDHPSAGPLTYPGRPFVMHGAERAAQVGAPRLDEHGDVIREQIAKGGGGTTSAGEEVADQPLPLAGLRVAEITVVWAGPHVTQLLAEWGADVIRVEPCNKVQPITRGMERVPSKEQARTLATGGGALGFPDHDPADDPWNRNASFNSHARNKRSMVADIMTEEGRDAVLRLVAHCDVLVENNVPETIEKAGLDYETLRAINPRLIIVRMPAFALDGPYRNFRAFGLHVEAMIGHTLLRGYPGERPDILSESLASDGISGVQGALAVMLALRRREATGEGQLMELPLTEGFLPTLGEYFMDYAMNGRDTPTQGNHHPWHAPHNVYPCAGDDQWIAIDVGTDEEFAALCRVLDRADLAERFATVDTRRAGLDELDAAIAAATTNRDKDELFHALQAVGVCAAPTRNAVEILDDPQLAARDFFEWLPTGEEQKPFRYPGLMFKMQRTPNRLQTGPVLLGADNDTIYRDLLGYSEAEYEALKETGTVDTKFPDSMWR